MVSIEIEERLHAYIEIEEQRDRIKKHISEEIKSNPSYSFSDDFRYHELIKDESITLEWLEFNLWKFKKELEELVTDFILCESDTQRPPVLYDDFEAFIKHCEDNSKNNTTAKKRGEN